MKIVVLIRQRLHLSDIYFRRAGKAALVCFPATLTFAARSSSAADGHHTFAPAQVEQTPGASGPDAAGVITLLCRLFPRRIHLLLEARRRCVLLGLTCAVRVNGAVACVTVRIWRRHCEVK